MRELPIRDLVKVNSTEQDLAAHVYLINNKQDCLRKLQLILGQRSLFGKCFMYS